MPEKPGNTKRGTTMFKRILIAAFLSTMTFNGALKAGDSPEVEELFRTANQQVKAKQYEKAIDTINLILSIDDEYTDAWAQGAWILNEQKKYPQAASAAAKAIKLNPNHSMAWRERGYALLNDNKYKEGCVALFAAIDKNPKNWTAYDYLANAFEKKGDVKLANDVRVLKASEQAKTEQPEKRTEAKRVD
jgi:predicted Zn-dependent protease